MIAAFALAIALAWECGPYALATDDCHREARIWKAAQDAAAIEWVIPESPQAP